MNSKNRLRRNGATKHCETQDSSPDPETVTIVINDKSSGAEFCRFDLPQAVYATIKKVCLQRKISVLRFIENATRRKLARENPVMVTGGAK